MGRLARAIGVVIVSSSCPARADIAWSEITTIPGENPALAAAPGGGVHVVVADGLLHHVELNASGEAVRARFASCSFA